MCDQFGSAWDGTYVLGKGHRCSIPLPSFQGRSSASSFHASPPWLKLLNMSDLLRCKLPVMVALPDGLFAWWFPFTPACPGQYTHSSFGGLSSMSDCFHLQCQDDCLHGWWSYLARQWSPTTTVFLWLSRQRALWALVVMPFSRLRSLTSGSVLPALCTFSSRSVSQRCQTLLDTFPTPWFAWALSAGLLVVSSPLPDPSQTCLSQSAYLCVFHSFRELVAGIFYNTGVCLDLLHTLSG